MPGPDPGRYVLPEGNTIASKGDGPKMSRQVRAWLIPAEFQVVVSPDEDAPALLERLALINDYAEDMHGRVSRLAVDGTGRTLGRFATTIRKMLDLAARAQAGTLSPARYGSLDGAMADGMRQSYARVLSGNLTKLSYASDWIKRHGDQGMIRDDQSRLRFWAEFDQQREVIVGSMHIIQGWLELLAWKQAKTRSDPVIEALHKVVSIDEQAG